MFTRNSRRIETAPDHESTQKSHVTIHHHFSSTFLVNLVGVMLMNKGELTEEEEKEWFFKIDLLRLGRKMIKRNLPQGLKLLQIVNQRKISC